MSWQDYVRRVTPYVPGEQPDKARVIKLNTNENPYPPAPGVAAAIRALPEETLRLYPDPTSGILVKALADRYHVMNIPTVLLIKNGEVVETSIGYKPKAEMEELLK